MNSDFEHAAAHGQPMPSGLSQPEQLLYQSLCVLYSRYRRGEISREQAADEKQKLLSACEANEKHVEFVYKMSTYYANLRTAVNAAQTEFRKNPTVETAKKFSDSLDGFTD